jgi:excisionase family DNA binding protein
MSQQPEQALRRPYSVEEAAQKAGVDDKTIRKEIASGKIKVVRLGRRILVCRAPYDRLIEQGETH